MARKTSTVDRLSAPEASPPPTPHRRVARGDGFVSIYTNDIQVQTSPWDMRLVLSELGDSDDVSVNVKQLAEIRLSIEIAKRLTLMLAEQLNLFEATFGQIPGPKA